jgi:hypothetical protein
MVPTQPRVDQEPFIPGVYNYCDRWCNACPVAARCRVYADMQASGIEGPPRSWVEEVRDWLQKTLDLVRRKCAELDIDFAEIATSAKTFDEAHGVVPFDFARLVIRARAYEEAVFKWQRARSADPETFERSDPSYPRDVIDHFAVFIGSKIYRAVCGLADEEASDEAGRWAKDSDGSAKAAILAAERSRAAWAELRGSGLVSDQAADVFEHRLTWLILELDRLFPNARRFVRPGFDG